MLEEKLSKLQLGGKNRIEIDDITCNNFKQYHLILLSCEQEEFITEWNVDETNLGSFKLTSLF
jgi:hypothetical protein